MPRENVHIFALNGGEISPKALSRTDLTRMKLTATTCLNCIPNVIGHLQFRPGTKYTGTTKSSGIARNLPFIFAADDTAKIELSDNLMRIWIDDELLARNSVSTTVTNGSFGSSAGWTLTTTKGGTANINSTVSGALVLATTVRGSTALATRSVSVAGGDQATEHGIKIVVANGEVKFRIGTTSGAQDVLEEQSLGTGTHSLAFTPNAATIHVYFTMEAEARVVVDSCQIESSGTLELTTPWAEEDLYQIRYDQSGDVIFVTHPDYFPPKRIERRAAHSWSIVDYEFVDGPWRGKTASLNLTPSVRNGNGTLTSSVAFFSSDDVGKLFKLNHSKTIASSSLADDGRFTDTVRVSGDSRYDIDSDGDDENTDERDVLITITGTWSGRVSVQISEDEGDTWQTSVGFNGNTSTTRAIGREGTIVLVRAGFIEGDYTSGTAVVTLSYEGGGGAGVARVTEYTSATVVQMEVVSRFHDVTATKDWEESWFSTPQGGPNSMGFFEGRLWWGAQDKIFGSGSDDFTQFAPEDESDIGDADPILRSIATGPINTVLWILGLARLCMGTVGAEPVGRSSSFDEPMSPTNFSIKDASTQGNTNIQAVKVDRAGVFIQRSGKRAFELVFSVDQQDYISNNLTRYHPTILEAGVKIMAVQRQPDTRIWFILDDGTAAVLVYEKAEDVLAWHRIETEGEIEDCIVLPNTDDDDVYFIVKRNINGSDVRYQERLAYDHQGEGGDENFMADAYKVVSVTATDVATGLSHLEGETVVAWVAGSPAMAADYSARTFTVSGGQITLPDITTGDVVIGLPYQGQWKSTKLAYAAALGTAIGQSKSVPSVWPLLINTHLKAVKFGPDFDTLQHMPEVIDGLAQTVDTMLDEEDGGAYPIPAKWNTDSRLCMEFNAPFPATVLGVGITVITNG